MRLYWLCAFRVALFCGVLFIFAGCKGDEAVRSVTGQDTPQETIRKLAASARSKNLDDYLDTIQHTERQREYFVAMFELHTAYELQRALVGRFGDGAWAEFQSVDLSPEFKANFGYGVPPLGDEWHKSLEIEITGDRATWVCKWGRRPAKQYLVFDGEQKAWFIVYPDVPKEKKRIQAMCEFPRRYAKAARLGLKVVDEPNITVREIKLRMAEVVFQRPRQKGQ